MTCVTLFFLLIVVSLTVGDKIDAQSLMNKDIQILDLQTQYQRELNGTIMDSLEIQELGSFELSNICESVMCEKKVGLVYSNEPRATRRDIEEFFLDDTIVEDVYSYVDGMGEWLSAGGAITLPKVISFQVLNEKN